MIAPAKTALRGITLVELLVVLFIAGLIAATLSLNFTGSTNRELNVEAEKLAIILMETTLQARASGKNHELRTTASGYTLMPLGDAGEATAEPRRNEFPKGITITGIQTGERSDLSSHIIAARGVGLPVTLTLASADQEIEIISEGMNRYRLSSIRPRLTHAKR